jgi:DNA repair protein RadA/Sms
MSKTKSVFVCQNCGADSPKWIGRCPSCKEWNTYVEELVLKDNPRQNFSGLVSQNNSAQLITEVNTSDVQRIDTLSPELNRVLGGGLVPGSLVLIGGEPGIGKSTLLLQIALSIKNFKILYITGEESAQQIKLRAERIKTDNSQSSCFILCETQLENIFLHLEKEKPGIIIIDSIQTIFTDKIESSAGSVSQIRECTALILKYAKIHSIPVLLIGHINKDGNIAGPKVLEHIVDCVLQFEGDHNYMYRILRATKNRYGSTSEIGIYEMQSSGLIEISNPSELLLSQYDSNYSGIAISATIEGIRAFLIEIQALVSSAVYGNPQRSSTGFDLRRLNMLLAVLEKRAGFRLGSKDVFLNIAGGLKVDDPAIDLAVICSILSSDLDIPINKNICFSGEVGLSGEIRPVNRIEQRISEAQKLGFSSIYISKYNKTNVDFSKFNIIINFVSKVEDVFQQIFK